MPAIPPLFRRWRLRLCPGGCLWSRSWPLTRAGTCSTEHRTPHSTGPRSHHTLTTLSRRGRLRGVTRCQHRPPRGSTAPTSYPTNGTWPMRTFVSIAIDWPVLAEQSIRVALRGVRGGGMAATPVPSHGGTSPHCSPPRRRSRACSGGAARGRGNTTRRSRSPSLSHGGAGWGEGALVSARPWPGRPDGVLGQGIHISTGA